MDGGEPQTHFSWALELCYVLTLIVIGAGVQSSSLAPEGRLGVTFCSYSPALVGVLGMNLFIFFFSAQAVLVMSSK